MELKNETIAVAINMLDHLKDTYTIDGGGNCMDLFELFSYQLLYEIGLSIKKEPEDVPKAYMALKNYGLFERFNTILDNNDQTIIRLFHDRNAVIAELLQVGDDLRQRSPQNPGTVRSIIKTAQDIVRMFVPHAWGAVPQLMDVFSEKCILTKNAGLVYTPSHIADMVAQLVCLGRPEQLGLSVWDPACGSGELLLKAFDYIGNKNATCHFVGVEQNDQLRRIAKIGGFFRGLDFELISENQIPERPPYDIILSNPPFGSTINTPDNMGIERSYELPIHTKNPYLQIMQRIFLSLAPSGIAAVIVPDGFLFNISADYRAVREWMVDKFQIEGIITLPKFTFAPYTNLNSSILVFSNSINKKQGYRQDAVFYYEILSDGFSKDTKRKRVKSNDLKNVLHFWTKRDFYLGQWNEALSKDATKNVFGILTPSKWDEKQICFANIQDIRENDYILLQSRYRCQKDLTENVKNPMELLLELQDLEEKSMKQLELLKEGLKFYE